MPENKRVSRRDPLPNYVRNLEKSHVPEHCIELKEPSDEHWHELLLRKSRLYQELEENSWARSVEKHSSDSERIAAEIVSQIREDEKSMYGNDYGGPFYANREQIKRSHLFRISERVPKGADLFLRAHGAVPMEHLLSLAATMDTTCIHTTRALLDKEDLKSTGILFCVRPLGYHGYVNVFSPDYNTTVQDSSRWPVMKYSIFRELFAEYRVLFEMPMDMTPEAWILEKFNLSGISRSDEGRLTNEYIIHTFC